MSGHKVTFESALDLCGRLDQPGRGLDNPAEVNYADKQTSLDQSWIEDQLDRMELAGRRLLHVGVGNSGLAVRLAPRLRLIDGLTVDRNEKARADRLGLDNYHVFLMNKYTRHVYG